MTFLAGKSVLVTGGTGLIGIPLVGKLVEMGARVRVASLDQEGPFGGRIEFMKGDLCEKSFCEAALKDIDVVFHLAGIKGGIGVSHSKASTFLVRNILMNIQVMEAARRAGIERFLYASSICIYPPARVFEEKNAFSGFPHPSDKFGGMAKLIGEMQIEAYRLQYHLDNFLTVRPANTYGPFDNFDPRSALIIPALIHRLFAGENPLTVWGDGTAVRDFVYAEDVADLMLLMVERNERTALNAGSGEPATIRTVAETVVRCVREILGTDITLKWDASKPSGEQYRTTSIEEARTRLGWSPRYDLEQGIRETVRWYHENRTMLIDRYSILSEEQ
ncbi:MAG TPA: NAD-dependent epimerase/dehydratase family protein [Syntrophales bacterium]|nr:NAD-dependent epimerase/dehydratase family protein [Syntrophales bacterium]